MRRGTKTNRKKLLERFAGNEELLARYGVTEEELELLNTVSLFGSLCSSRDIAFILKNMRGVKPTR